MLKKLNGKITKSLFYLKNNFLSLVFKLCVVTTMLILIYLVCILRQTDSARPREYIDTYPIENSQKLMLTTPSTTSESPPSTTEGMTTVDNFLSKTSEYYKTESLFLLQEQATTPMVTDQTTTSCMEPETTAETTTEALVNPNGKSTIPFKRSLSIDELLMWETTTENLKMETTFEPEEMLEEQEEEKFSTNVVTSTTTDSSYLIEDTTTVSPTANTEYGDLFMDNWSNYLPTEYDNSQQHPAEETSSQLNDIQESAENIFLSEDNESGTLEAPILQNNSEETSSIEEHLPHSAEEIEPNDTAFRSGNLNKESADTKMFSIDLPPILSPTNLFNLFSLDHLPAPSNMKPRWWSRSKNAPKPVGIPARSRKRHANSILPIKNSEEVNSDPNDLQHVNQFRGLNRVLNRRLKDSVNFFERLFGNFHQQQ